MKRNKSVRSIFVIRAHDELHSAKERIWDSETWWMKTLQIREFIVVSKIASNGWEGLGKKVGVVEFVWEVCWWGGRTLPDQRLQGWMGNGRGEKGEINFATVPSSVAVSLPSVCMTQNLPGKVSTSLRIKEHRRILFGNTCCISGLSSINLRKQI